jgi:hypothetical protein
MDIIAAAAAAAAAAEVPATNHPTSPSACKPCYLSKQSCDKRRPCSRCVKAGRECESRQKQKLGRPRKDAPKPKNGRAKKEEKDEEEENY